MAHTDSETASVPAATVAGVLELTAKRAAEDACWLTDDISLTFAEAYDHVRRVAARLSRLDVGKGVRVATMAPNSLDHLRYMYALAQLGAVEVPVNRAYTAAFVRHVLTESRASHLVLHASLVDEIDPGVLQGTQVRTVIIQMPTEAMDSGECDVVEQLRAGADVSVVPIAAIGGDETAGKDEDVGQESTEENVQSSDPAMISFTSGTTGPPRGVVLSHAQITTHGRVFVSEIEPLTSDDVVYNPLPLFHLAGRAMTVAAMLAGASTVVGPFSASQFWTNVERHHATGALLIGAMAQMLLNQPVTDAELRNTFRFMCLVPVPPGMGEEIEKRFDLGVCELYGLTEGNWVLARRRGEGPMGSCGRQTAPFQVELVDDTDQPVPAGEIGEIVARNNSPNTFMLEYAGQPEATLVRLRNLWLHTGDVAYRDNDGWYHFVGRNGDTIRRRGERIGPHDIEVTALHHDQVSEAVALAVPSELSDDEIKLVVTPTDVDTPPQLTDLLALCRAELPAYMVPRYYEVRTDLPRTANGKVQKKALREEEIGPSTWDAARQGDA